MNAWPQQRQHTCMMHGTVSRTARRQLLKAQLTRLSHHGTSTKAGACQPVLGRSRWTKACCTLASWSQVPLSFLFNLPTPSTITDQTKHTMLPSATATASASAFLCCRLRPITRASSSLLRCRPRHMTTITTGGPSTSKPHGPSHQRGELLEEPPRNLKDIKFSLKDGVATITLDRPHRLNALSEDMGESMMRLCEYLTEAPADKVRACIVTGGPRAFSTGRDLKDSKLHTTLVQRERYMKLALDSVMAVHRLV